MTDERPAYCPHCGEETLGDGDYCSHCGEKLVAPTGSGGSSFSDGSPPVEVKDDTDEIGETADVSWRCVDCGREHVRNNPPCNNCGGMDFQTIDNNTATSSRTADESSVTSSTEELMPSPSRGGQILAWLALISGVVGLVAIAIVAGPLAIIIGLAATKHRLGKWSSWAAYGGVVLGTVDLLLWGIYLYMQFG